MQERAAHAKLVRVPCARARIVSINKTGALGVPGVRMVFSGEDLEPPYFRYGPVFADKPIIAIGETKYDGDPVAVVVAETVDAAEAGARAVEVQYEELPAVVPLYLCGGAYCLPYTIDGQPFRLRSNDPVRPSRQHSVEQCILLNKDGSVQIKNDTIHRQPLYKKTHYKKGDNDDDDYQQKY